MEDDLLSINEFETPITIGAIAIDRSVQVPCFIVHYDAKYPSFTNLFKKFRGIRLEVLNADNGGYFFSISSDRRVLKLRESEFNKNINAGQVGVMRLAERMVNEGIPEFQSTYLASKEVGARFLEFLSENDGGWVLVMLASEATLVFVNRNGKIIGLFPLPREYFSVVDS